MPSGIEPKTEGQLRFLQVEGSELDLAGKLGCGPAIVGHWKRGRRLPDETNRHKIELLFGIPRKSWDFAPGAYAPTSTPSAPKVDALTAGDEGDDGTTLEITNVQVHGILEELKKDDLTDSAKSKLYDILGKFVAIRARLERDKDLLEDRVVREHPEWIRTKAAILAALKPYPEAMRAVIEALK